MALSQVDGLGPATLKKLIDLFGSSEILYSASFLDLKNKSVPDKIITLLLNAKKNLDPDLEVKKIVDQGIAVCSVFEADYPPLLKEIFDPPVLFYYRGNLKLTNNPLTLAVVGSRKISNYATAIMPNILAPAITQGVVIISGLAFGVDQLAHQLALANGGQTIAVVGSGLSWEYLYPQANVNLAKKILEQGGLLISENPPASVAMPYSFPRRNRIISGLAKASLIIEAAQKSGALITASSSLEQNREVLVVPQNINTPNSVGVNNLIKNGAKVVTGANDILELFNLTAPCLEQNPILEKTVIGLNQEEKIIYQLLSFSPIHIDKIIENCNLETSLVNGLLIQLEIKGLIKNLGGQIYIKI